MDETKEKPERFKGAFHRRLGKKPGFEFSTDKKHGETTSFIGAKGKTTDEQYKGFSELSEADGEEAGVHYVSGRTRFETEIVDPGICISASRDSSPSSSSSDADDTSDLFSGVIWREWHRRRLEDLSFMLGSSSSSSSCDADDTSDLFSGEGQKQSPGAARSSKTMDDGTAKVKKSGTASLVECEESDVSMWMNAINKNSSDRIKDGSDFRELVDEWPNDCLRMTVCGDKEISSFHDVFFSISKNLKPHSSISYTELKSVIEKKEAKLVGLVVEPCSDQMFLMKKLAYDLMKQRGLGFLFSKDDSKTFEIVNFINGEKLRVTSGKCTPLQLLSGDLDFPSATSHFGHTLFESKEHVGYNWLIKNSSQAFFFFHDFDFILETYEKIGYFDPAPPQAILYNLVVGNLFPDATIVVSCQGHLGILEGHFRNLQELKRPRMIIAASQTVMEWIKQINYNCKRWIRTELSRGRMASDVFPAIIDYSSSSKSIINALKRLKSQGSISYTELRGILEQKQVKFVSLAAPSSDKTLVMKRLADDVRMTQWRFRTFSIDIQPKSFQMVHVLTFETQNIPDQTTPYDFLFKKSLASNRNFPHRSSSEGAMSSVDPRTHDGYNWLIENSNEAVFFIDGIDFIVQGHEHEKIGYFDLASPSTILYNLIVGNLFPDATIVVSCRGHFGIHTLQELKRPRLIITVAHFCWIKQINNACWSWITTEPSLSQLEHKGLDVFPTMEIIDYNSSSQSVLNDLKGLKSQGPVSCTKVWDILERKQIHMVVLVGDPGTGKTLLMKRFANNLLGETDFGSYSFLTSTQLFELVHFVTFETQNIPDQTTPYDFLFKKSMASNHDFPHRSSSEGPMSSVDPRTHDGYNWLIKNSSEAIFFIVGTDFIIQGHEHEKIGYFDSASPTRILYNLIVGNLFPDATVVVSCRRHFGTWQKLKRSWLIIAQSTMSWIKQINDNCWRWIWTEPIPRELKHKASDVFPAMEIIYYSSSGQSVMNDLKQLKAHDSISYTKLRDILEQKQIKLLGLVGEAGSRETFLMKKLAHDVMIKITSKSPFFKVFGMVHFRKFEKASNISGQTTPYDFLIEKYLVSNNDYDADRIPQVDPRTHDGYNWLIKNSSEAIFFIDGLDSIIHREVQRQNIGHFDTASPSTILYNLIIGNLFPDATIVVSCGDQSFHVTFPGQLIISLQEKRVFTEIHWSEGEGTRTVCDSTESDVSLTCGNSSGSKGSDSLEEFPLDKALQSSPVSDLYIEFGNGISVNFFKPIKQSHRVFWGKLKGDDTVAVKKMEFTAKNKELVQKLLSLEKHPNIVHCKAMSIHEDESGEKFIYTAMKLCDSITLLDMVESEAPDFTISKEIKLQILHALAYLHENEIYLGRLETKHIFISRDRKNVKINPFRTTRDLTDHARSERGPLDTNRFPFSEQQDIFSAGAIFAYRSARHANEKKGSSSPSVSKLDEEFLIKSMLEPEPEKRTTINDAIRHPVFWEESEKFIFCRNLFDNLLSFSDSPGVLEQLEKLSAQSICQGWLEKLVLSEKEEFDIQAELRASKNKTALLAAISKTALLAAATSQQSGSAYDQKSAFSLLRFIINRYNGFENDPKEVQILFGSQKGIWQFFVKRFPDLFYKLYNFSKQLVLDTDLWRFEVSEPGLDVKSLYNDISPVSVIGQQGGILRVGGTVVSIDEGTFLYPCAIWATEDLDRSTWDDEYISISPQLNIRFQYPLLKPATVCMNTWCTSETDDCEVYVFHYTKEDGSPDIIATLPLGNEREVEFKCQDFSPIGLKAKRKKQRQLLFDVAGFVYVDKNEFNFVFCLDETRHVVKSFLGSVKLKPLTPLTNIHCDHKIHLKLTCKNPDLEFSSPELDILVESSFTTSYKSSVLENPKGNQCFCNVVVACTISISTGSNSMEHRDKRDFQHIWRSDFQDTIPSSRNVGEKLQSTQPVQDAYSGLPRHTQTPTTSMKVKVDVHMREDKRRTTRAGYVAMDSAKLQTGVSENELETTEPASSVLPSSSQDSTSRKTAGDSTDRGDELTQSHSSSKNITAKTVLMDQATVNVKETGAVSLVDCKFGSATSESELMKMVKGLASDAISDDKRTMNKSTSSAPTPPKASSETSDTSTAASSEKGTLDKPESPAPTAAKASSEISDISAAAGGEEVKQSHGGTGSSNVITTIITIIIIVIYHVVYLWTKS